MLICPSVHVPSLASRQGPPVLGQGTTALAELDRLLASGTRPTDFVARLATAKGLPLPAGTALTLEGPAGPFSMDDGTSEAQEGKRSYRGKLIRSSVEKGVWGFMIGLACWPVMPQWAPVTNFWVHPLAGLAGLAIGAYLTFDTARLMRKGQVEVTVDGQTNRKPFYDDPRKFERTPQEMRAQLLAAGQLGDRIAPYGPRQQDLPQVDADALARLQPYASRLKQLGQDRRLVADLGQRSRYGRDVLNFVDANTARTLLAAGKQVHVVNTRQQTDIPHSYQVTADNASKTSLLLENHQYVERKLEYTLTAIDQPAGLDQVTDARGLPEGFCGIYADASPCSEQVYNAESRGFGSSVDNQKVLEHATGTVSRDDHSAKPASDAAIVAFTQQRDYRGAAAMVGTLAALLLLTGSNPPYIYVPLAAACGVIGREVGKQLNGWR